MLPFNKPYFTGKETKYISEAIASGKVSGDGIFTNKCQTFFETKYGFKKTYLTTSCTDALELATLLLNIKEGDEIIIPSYTFVSSANPFVLRGAKIVFTDSCTDNPNIDANKIEELITPKTKAIVVVHYAGIACDMDLIMSIANKNNLFVIEDAAHALDSFYKSKPLGSIGHMAAFSFHETKNVISGEGGMLVINDDRFMARAEIIREKGTNRSSFIRGEVDKYGWVDIGSSFLPSDIIAAFLYAQLESLDIIQHKRKEIWNQYYQLLKPLEEKGKIKLAYLPNYATNNAHMFYIICNNLNERTQLIAHLKQYQINSVFHYLSLHKSPYYASIHGNKPLPIADSYSDCLLRLPFYFELTSNQINEITNCIYEFYSH